MMIDTKYCIECSTELRFESPGYYCAQIDCPLYRLIQIGEDNPLNARNHSIDLEAMTERFRSFKRGKNER